MSELTFKAIINQVKCEAIPSIMFTEADLVRAKTCIQTVTEPDILINDPTAKILEQIEKDTLSKTGCIPAATEKVKEIIAEETKKIPTSIKAAIVKSKVEELIDNLDIIKIYNQERVDFFNSIVDITEPLASQYRYWEDEVDTIEIEIDQITKSIAAKISNTRDAFVKYKPTNFGNQFSQAPNESQKDRQESLIKTIIFRIARLSNLYPTLTIIDSGTAISTYEILKNPNDTIVDEAINNLISNNLVSDNLEVIISPTLNLFNTVDNTNKNFTLLNINVTADDPDYSDLKYYIISEPAKYIQYFNTELPELNAWITLLKKLAFAYREKLNFKNEALVAQSNILSEIDIIDITDRTIYAELSEAFLKISGQISLGLTTQIIPTNIEIFNLKLVPRIIDGNFVKIKLPVELEDGSIGYINAKGSDGKLIEPVVDITPDTIIPIKNSPYLTTNIFDNVYVIRKFSDTDDPNDRITDTEDSGSYYDPDDLPFLKPRADYASIPGLLYNGAAGEYYNGLYNRLADPINNLFTLVERGLSLSPINIDASFKDSIEAGTIKEKINNKINDDSPSNTRTLYISNIETYSKFYEDFGAESAARIKIEREQTYPSVILEFTNIIKEFAKKEVATIFRQKVNSSYLKFYRPVTYSQTSNIQYSQGIKEFNESPTLSTVYEYYLQSNLLITNKLADCKTELANLQLIIKENSLKPEILTDKILAIPCFKAAAAAIKKPADDCEAPAKLKLGKDPFIIRTVDGNDSGLPDITSQCYWKEFTNSLNKVAILPFPDTTGPPPSNLLFRYYPINALIPTSLGILTLPLPQFYKPLISIPTPLGTIVIILGLPITCKQVIVPFPIPLPSLYVLYFGPDGNKYLAVSTNPQWLYSDPATNKPLVIGYELDNGPDSRNPLGINILNPYKGQVIKGALSSPLALVAAAAKAARLAQIAEDIAAGRIPFLDKLSEAEMMLAMLIADGGGEFTRDIVKLQSNINKQLNKIGDIPINEISALKDRVRQNRAEQEDAASNETDLAKKRKDRKAARDANPLTIPQQIDATIADFTNFYDKKMKFGILQFPKDASKHNPGLPEVLKCIEDIIELIALGSAIPLISTLQEQIITLIAIILETKKVKDLLQKYQSFNLNTAQGIKEFKDLLKDFFKSILDYIKGEDVGHDTDENVSEAEKAEILRAKAARQETIKKILSATAVALLSIPAINIFDLNKKCCEVKPTELFPGVSPDLAIALALIYELFNALINSLTAESIMDLLGLSQIPNDLASAIIPIILEQLILMIPPIPLPNIAGFLQYIIQSVVPMVTSLSVLKSVNPLHPPLVPIVIPLDPLIKALVGLGLAALIEAILRLLLRANKLGSLTITSDTFTVGGGSNSTQTITATTSVDKNLITQVLTTACGKDSTVSLEIVGVAGSNSTIAVDTNGNPILKRVVLTVISKTGKRFSLPKLPLFPIDISQYLYLLTAADLIEVVRELITLVFEEILIPIATIVDVIANIAKALKTFSYNIVEAGILQINLIKLAIMKIDSEIPPGYKMMIPNPLLTNIIKLGALFALEQAEPFLSPVAWIASLSLCVFAPPITFSSVTAARLFHPILNSDDLPPWERLTHKNPLFTIFLDELAWKFSMNATGTLLFTSKSPGLIPLVLPLSVSPINPVSYPHIL
jgi:hypothetical protein